MQTPASRYLSASRSSGNGLARLENLMARLNNRVLNPSQTREHNALTQGPDVHERARLNVRRSAGGNDAFRLSQKQIMAQTSSLLSSISKRYL